MEKYEKFETLSNLAYAVAGIASFLLFGNVLFAIVMITLGAGSYWYHKEKDHQVFDYFGMSVVMLTCLGMMLNSWWGWLSILVALCLYSFFIITKFGSTLEIGVMSILTFGYSAYHNGIILTLLIVGLFAGALYIKKQDHVSKGLYYDSHGHSWWHLITALGFFLLVHANDILR